MPSPRRLPLSVDLLLFRPRLRNITSGAPFSRRYADSTRLDTGPTARRVRLAGGG
jgi:hypothetical protein